jgi:pimeloyl-ACP methyl ester carboxylesterase
MSLNPHDRSDRPRLLLLPGLHGTEDLFEPLVDELAARFETVCVSYPVDEALGYQDLLHIVTSRIPKEKPYLILGESFSGPLAVKAASKHPENLLGIILVATFVTSPVPRWIRRFRSFLGSPILDVRPRSFIIKSLMGSGIPEKTVKWALTALPALKRDVLAARIEAVLDVNVREELKGLEVPVLYIAGSRDWLVGKKCIDVIWLCRPDVQIEVLEGVHMILQTNAAEAAEAIKEFCGRLWSVECGV